MHLNDKMFLLSSKNVTSFRLQEYITTYSFIALLYYYTCCILCNRKTISTTSFVMYKTLLWESFTLKEYSIVLAFYYVVTQMFL